MDKESLVEITKKSYNEIAEDYVSRMNSFKLYTIYMNWLCKRFLKKLPNTKSGNILVVGSSGGRNSIYMAKNSEYSVTGVDLAPKMVRIATEANEKENVSNCKFLDVDIRTAELKGKYNGVFCDGVLYHIPREDLPSVLEKIHNALLHNGVLYANFKKGTGQELQDNPKSFPGHPRPYWFYLKKDLEELFTDAKFNYKIKRAISPLFEEFYFHVWAKPIKQSIKQ